MRKTEFSITGMDCPAEEQLIRMKLADLREISSLDFEIDKRRLVVFHTGDYEEIYRRISLLNLGASLIRSESVANGNQTPDDPILQRSLLRIVLVINLGLFMVECLAGLLADSLGLVADGLDMLADAMVYTLALMAIGGSAVRKKYVARIAGYMQLLLAGSGFSEVIRRFIGDGQLPEYSTMIFISLLALAGNGYCLYLLLKTKSQEAHIQASMIFTSGDVMVNLGIIVAAGLVYFTGSPYPDLIVGAIVFLMVARGSFAILKLAA